MKKLVVFVSFLLFVIVTVTAQPPFESIQLNPEGLLIAYPQFTYVKIDNNFTFEFHVFNSTTGIQVTGAITDCYVHIYAPNGTKVYEEDSVYADGEFSNFISHGTFSVRGEYGFVIICNTTTTGGFASGRFYSTTNGHVLLEENESSPLPMTLIMMFFFFMAYLYSEKRWKLKMFFNALGLLTALLVSTFITEFNGNNPNLYNVSLSFQILITAIVSFYFVYMLIYYTLDVLQTLHNSAEKRRSAKSDPY